MSHRGPDDAGEWWSADGRVGLVHRRLAIVDLSPAGHQPMRDATGQLHIVYNGEIYNFRALRAELEQAGEHFVSASDTEVILAAYRRWGTDCLARLQGMFALALHDAGRGTLLLARDRAGEKPLFYRLETGEIRFASELKGLLADGALPRRVDPEALDCFLAMGFVPGALCMLAGFAKLPAAHALEFDLQVGTCRTWRYWQPPPLVPQARSTPPEALLDQLESCLEGAVRRQLVADVPVGVLLSGGVDSSLVTALAARALPTVRTFTVRFPGHGAYDETSHARLIANHFGTQHIEIDAESITTGLLPTLAEQFDEPMADSSMVPTYLLSRVVRRHCTVALGGDGGDELFGGYMHYERIARLRQYAAWLPGPLRGAAAGAAAHLMPVGLKGRNWALALGCDLRRGVPAIAQLFDRVSRDQLLVNRAPVPGVAELIREQRIPAVAGLLERAMHQDFENYLAEDILVKVDRASMLCSLEVRAPLLDAEMIDFAFARVPVEQKVAVGTRKILLKKLAARLLPAQFDQQRKQGFSIPLATWLRGGEWRDYFRAVLLDPGQRSFEQRGLAAMLDAEGPRRSNAERLFGLVMFELWRRKYGVELA
jgi:asparagine synthase (glutamine-hydrolysing)